MPIVCWESGHHGQPVTKHVGTHKVTTPLEEADEERKSKKKLVMDYVFILKKLKHVMKYQIVQSMEFGQNGPKVRIVIMKNHVD